MCHRCAPALRIAAQQKADAWSKIWTQLIGGPIVVLIGVAATAATFALGMPQGIVFVGAIAGGSRTFLLGLLGLLGQLDPLGLDSLKRR